MRGIAIQLPQAVFDIDHRAPTRLLGDEEGNDEIVTYRVGGLLPVIVWDAETRAARGQDALGIS